jgi:tRNA 2-selenouridine synthase
VLQGGYKAFRALVREQLDEQPARFEWRVVTGRTGSAKTRLLHALRAEGGQVLDLEGLARHRGSVLGGLPEEPSGRSQGSSIPSGDEPARSAGSGGGYVIQPTQKAFDTAVWHALRGFDAARPVFVESESRKIGALAVPEALLAAMRGSPHCIAVSLPPEQRLALLLEEYGFFAAQTDRFCAHLDSLVELRGRAVVQRWQAMARAGRWSALFDELMRDHYDPLYERSMRRNFAGLARAEPVELVDAGEPALRAAARRLLAAAPPG